MKKELERKFKESWKKLRAVTGHSVVFERLVKAYSESHRYYHNINHIASCLSEFEQVREQVANANAIEFSIWTHDWVYDSRRRDNEEKSCLAAVQALQKAKVGYMIQKDVWRLIMATKPGSVLKHNDEKFLVGIDISIFGQPSEVFDIYEKQIRQEYDWVPETEFKSARLNILKQYLESDSIFKTSYFQKKYEEQARLNLNRSIQALGN